MAKKIQITPYLFILPALILFLVFELYPSLGNFLYAFFDYSGVPGIPMKFVGFWNFEKAFVLKSDVTLKAIVNGFKYILFIGVPQNILAIYLAFILSNRITKVKVPGKNALRAIIFLPNVLGPMVVTLIWSIILESKGFINYFLKSVGLEDLVTPWLGDLFWAIPSVSLVQIWMSIGYAMLIYYAQFQNIPDDVLDAANVDGATGFTLFRKIILPLIMPAITINFILTAVGCIKLFEVPYLLTGSSAANPAITFSSYIFAHFQLAEYGFSSALQVILFFLAGLITMTLLFITRKHEVEM